jgi:DNA-binding LacI/PurR family transcriptional regulator
MSKTLLLRETQNSSQLHIVLRERLRESLVSQPPGKRVASERTLAKEFGVSTATVSRALQELQQEGILRRIPGKGTYLSLSAVDELGQNWNQAEYRLPVGRSVDLNQRTANGSAAPGIIMPAQEVNREAREATLNAWIVVLETYEASVDRTSEVWPQRIISRLEYLIADQGGKTKITVGHALTEQQCVDAWHTALEEKISCVFFIVNDRNPLVDVWVEQLAQSHIGVDAGNDGKQVPAIVQISLSSTPQAYFDTVSFDGEWGTYLATTHLLKLGHRNIAFLAPSQNFSWLEQRIVGFHRALRGAGVVVPRDQSEFGVIRTAQVPDGPQMWQQLGECAAERVVANTSITAVLATNDQMASAFIDRARALGRAIPESLSVVGYDDWFASAIHGLTTVRPPIDEIADAALQLAKKQSANGLREHVHLFLKPTLMARTTTQALPAPFNSAEPVLPGTSG